MGLLDDAIREHLDLKRRRGADPAEIERAEREALGPVRRNREPGVADDPEAAAAPVLDPGVGSALDEPDEGIASDLVEEPYVEEELYEEEPEEAPVRGETYLEHEEQSDGEEEEEVFSPAPASEPELESESDPESEEVFAAGDEPFADEEDPHRTQLMQTVDIPAPAPEDATAQHDVERSFVEEDAFSAEPPPRVEQPSHAEHPDDGEDEDVLEETPEFLQDTPDHDRLWFEQRPPRDFDFDS
ncbi:MAG TPA: hypothetical protein VMF07_05555 [Solirubrobacteraceae bacterium]|nr:hypothetical protein [Solirubrobacteraceae bacterium]